MTTTPLSKLLQELNQAISQQNHEQAHALAQRILQLLAEQAQQIQEVELQVREALANLTWPVSPKAAVPDSKSRAATHGTFRGATSIPTQNIGKRGDEVADGVLFPLWFGTNRQPEGAGFGNARAATTSVGQVKVHIPDAHRFGEIGNSFWTRLKRLEWRADSLRLQSIDSSDAQSFYEGLFAEMQEARDAGRAAHALVFLHGYNCSFEDAAIRAAQIGFDLKVPGATAFFSWPSRASLQGYPADEASIEASEAAIAAFLVEFAQRSGADKVHLIAHSMGNRGLLRALQRIAADAQVASKVRFGQIFLAAPDVDRDLFLDLAKLYPRYSERTTLYASADDKPVYLSSKVHAAPRAGYFEPYTVMEGVDTVAVPDFNLDLLGHSYFAQAEALLHDMFDLMQHNLPPVQRQRLKEVRMGAVKFWKLAR